MNSEVEDDESDGQAPTPSELMRRWHPDLFSDSERHHAPIVPRAVLDHHLETLTNRKEENEFEYFARLVAEREICPNLRPQTGPTGGGDSKVDSETYPVAPELAARWYYGEPAAATERWVFAFSAKKKWRDKVKSDVDNIVSTQRPYTRIYFITNQYAPEKSRAQAEDSLTKVAGAPVTILDHTWLLEKVYQNDLVELAVRTLNMTGFSEIVNERIGPRDTARQLELERLDAAVADPSRYEGARYALAEDALQSALLARGLERPRSEIEGRFLAAARIADGLGHAGQRLRIAYNHAWTAYWWFDDPSTLNSLYDTVAEIALKSDDAADLEQALTLWQLLGPAVARGTLAKNSARVGERGQALADALDRVASIRERPNNAAHAETFRLVMKLAARMQQRRHDELPEVWNSLRAVLEKVEYLGDYPLERVYELIARIGEAIPESKEFDELYDALVALMERRRSEAEGGLAYKRRGEQKLNKGLIYEAIRMLGRAEVRLVKAEYIDELVETLVGIASAYRAAGLKWAARAKALIAADRLLSSVDRRGTLDPRAAVPLKLLIWIELELGRVPQILGAISIYRGLIGATEQPDEIAAKIPEQLQTWEAILGMLLMRADLGQLRALEQMPATLENEGLVIARGALLWALAGTQALRDDGFVPEDQSEEDIERFFAMYMDQPAAKQIPDRPLIADADAVILRSVILGVEVLARVSTNPDSIFLAEAILAALESFLSTSLAADVFPYKERLEFAVSPASDSTSPPSIVIGDATSGILISHGEGPFAGAADQPTLLNWLQEVLIRLATSMMMIRDPEAWLESVAGDEVGFGRALGLSAVGIASRNLFGSHPRILLSDWIDPESDRHTLRRSTPLQWESEQEALTKDDDEPVQFGEGEPPNVFNREAGAHDERRVLSPINIPLWDKAKWRATGFGWQEKPPVLMFGYQDYDAGAQIFREWKQRTKDVTPDKMLRIAIVRGIDRENPAAYVVHVAPNISRAERSGTMFYMASRINQMTPRDSFNLDQFLAAYHEHEAFLLAPMAFQQGTGFATLDPSLTLNLSKLFVREAWQIGDNDPDMSCIHEDDTPLIPDHVSDAPVLRTLERLRRMRGSAGTNH
jgi:hypothetical protein